MRKRDFIDQEVIFWSRVLMLKKKVQVFVSKDRILRYHRENCADVFTFSPDENLNGMCLPCVGAIYICIYGTNSLNLLSRTVLHELIHIANPNWGEGAVCWAERVLWNCYEASKKEECLALPAG